MSFAKYALIGASGIGKVHTRILYQLGAEVSAVLGSNENSAKLMANEISIKYGNNVDYFGHIDDLLGAQKSLNGILISSPVNTHYNYIIASLKKDLSIFCEKPYFWDKNYSSSLVKEKLSAINNYPNHYIHINTCNAYLIAAASDLLPNKKLIDSFEFSYHTNGSYRYTDIAIDLLPHALSLLLQEFGFKTISEIDTHISKHQFICSFIYGGINVKINFKQGDDVQKLLIFKINDHIFERVTSGTGSNYRINLQHNKSSELIRIEDPFFTSLKQFVKVSLGELKVNPLFYKNSCNNLLLMSEVLDSIYS